MKRHIAAILILTLTYFIGKRVLDTLVWIQIERDIKAEGKRMRKLITYYREMS